MQHDNNIENKLREIEAMEQPDVSQMDNHWQQMASMLQPSVLPVKKGWPKWMLNSFYAAAVTVLIGVAVWYLSANKNDLNESVASHDKKETKKNENINPVTVAPAIIIADSIVNPTTPGVLHQLKINPSLIYDIAGNGDSTKSTSQDSILATIKLKVTNCLSCPGKNDDKLVIIKTERELKLQNLFAYLKKEEQHFIIDNRRDTLLQFKEGTRLLIPANSFNGINGVELTGKEFYKTSDIILNQLHTESNKEQLETGGMLYLQASYKEKELSINKNNPLALFMADTSSRIGGMQLFYKQNPAADNVSSVGQETQMRDTASANNITWVAQPFRFNRLNTVVRVLNLVNMPYEVKSKSGKRIAYFLVDENLQVSKEQLKKLLKEKYGYDKIKLRNAEWWEVHSNTWAGATPYFNSFYATKMGDSLWMEKDVADKYKLVGTATKTISPNNNISMNYQGYQLPVTAFQQTFDKLNSQTSQDLKDKYGVSLDQLGWINCDRFYADNRKKISYQVDLGDSASNYYTMLVFDNINSMMTGYVSDNKVMFQNIPIGEPVKIISIGINQNGETVYSVTHTTTSEQELRGLQFQTTSVPDLKAALSKLDK